MIQLKTPEETVNWLSSIVTGDIKIDSRDVQQGDVFIAWPGAAIDGRKYVNVAFQNGAVACLVEHDGLEGTGYLTEFKNSIYQGKIASYKDLKYAIGFIASKLYNTTAIDLNVLAITGTNGKTSSAWWLSQALNAATAKSEIKNSTQENPSKCFMVGTLGIGVPMHEVSTGLTTPDPVILHKQIQTYASMGFKYCAIEASSIGIEEYRLNGVSIQTAIFTNFTQDHLDYHGSMNAYWKAKLKLFEWDTLKSAVINIDDVKGKVLVEHIKQRKLDIWTIGITEAARIQAHDIGYGKLGINFNITENEITHALQTQFYGEYNVSNILCVIAAMRACGFELKICIDACQALTSVPGRMDVINRDNQPLVVVDYAHTPDALKQALLALRSVAENRSGQLICLFGCGGNRDSSKRPLMAAIAEAYADQVIVTTDNPRMESANNIINNIMTGFRTNGKYRVELDRGLAIATTIANAKTNDVILIAGKGHENYQDEMGVKRYFSDKAQALMAMQAVSSVEWEMPS